MTYDGPQVFRAPFGNDVAKENFDRTVLEGVDSEEVAQHTDREFTDDVVRLWGTKASVEGSWEKIEPGDFLIFYRGGTYPYAAEVVGTERNEPLGKAIWPNYEEGAPWLCIIYLGEPVELDADAAEVADLAGYDIDYPMGFSPLNEMGVGGLRGRYGSIEEFVYGDSGGTATIDTTTQPRVDLPESLFGDLYFPDDIERDIREQLESALNAGKHVILTGPPGTGKTEIAQAVSEHLAAAHDGIYTGYQTTTATADWSTFETVGGYMPTEGDGEGLSFSPGQVLRCFRRNGTQRNDLLVIDEINRSDIDKSFGQLFTLLSGQAVQLPFTDDGEAVSVVPASDIDGSADGDEYVMPDSWRIFATMNSYDKTSLYEMSYAFMRRFAFVHVDAPDIPTAADDRLDLLQSYADVWNLDPERRTLAAVGDVWAVTNGRTDVRKIGPALVLDMLRHIEHASSRNHERAVTQAIANYVFPQLEGVRRRDRVVSQLRTLDAVDGDRLAALARDVLQVTLDETA